MDANNVSPRERQLLDIARRAKRWLAHESHGMHEDLLIGRELVRILALYDDVEPTADADRRRDLSGCGLSDSFSTVVHS